MSMKIKKSRAPKKYYFCGLLFAALLTGCAEQPGELPKEATANSEVIAQENLTETTPPPDGLPDVPVQPETLVSQDQVAFKTETALGKGVQKEVTENKLEEPMEPVSTEVSPARVTYAEGFYYEPLSDVVISRIYGLSYKEDCPIPYDDLRYVSVLHVDFNGVTQTGELICNKAVANDMVEIFYELYQAQYQIEKIRLVDEYGADDTLSITDNNTSCFNYRPVEGTKKLSKHALGAAIDINPFYNPYVTYPNGGIRISPIGSEPFANRELDFPHKIDYNDLCYQLFTAHGFTWGGDWKTLKDYQHFQKDI